MRAPRLSRPEAGLLGLLTLLAGCAAGPDFQPPAAPSTQAYAPGGLPAQTHDAPAATAGAQHFRPGAAVPADWWTAFGSPRLDAFIAAALRASPSVEAAQAALRAAHEGVLAQRATELPNVQASYNATRQRPAGSPPGDLYTLHTAQLTVGYTPDLFGGDERQVESLQAQAEQQLFQLRAARLTLAASIAAAAIQDGALREQIAVVQQMVEAGSRSLAVARRQWQAGYLSRLDVSLQESALAQNRQLLPPLQKQFAQNRDLLRALAGSLPDAEVPGFTLAEFRLPADLPLSLPAQVVAQRPDVRAAQAQLHAASAQVGVAVAARLPQLTLNGSVGGSAAQLGQVLSGGFFGIGATLLAPVFDGGSLLHRERAARANLEQAQGQYRQAVVTALQNVADSLHALFTDADAVEAAAQQAASTRTAMELTRRQYGHGYLDRVALIGAEQADRQAQLALAQARAARLADTAALFQALGGGWQQEPGLAQAGDEP